MLIVKRKYRATFADRTGQAEETHRTITAADYNRALDEAHRLERSLNRNGAQARLVGLALIQEPTP